MLVRIASRCEANGMQTRILGNATICGPEGPHYAIYSLSASGSFGAGGTPPELRALKRNWHAK